MAVDASGIDGSPSHMHISGNRTPSVSVVIPTHNRAGLLARSIESVLAQTFPDLECIVVDDGSTDNTAEVVRGFQDPRVRLVTLPTNCGLSRARNEGIRAARGEFVAFLDDDDEWLPRKLDMQVARLREADDPRATVVYCRCYVHDALTGRTTQTSGVYEGDIFGHLLRGWHPPTPSLFMVKRSSLLEVGGFDEGLPCAQDYDLWLRLAEASNHFAAVNEPLAVKHEHAEGHMSADPAVRVRGSEILDRKWGPAITRHLGPKAYRRWKARRCGNVQSAHFKRVRYAVAHGQRIEAWRHWLAMWRLLPWSRRNVLQAFALVTLGQGAYGALARAKGAILRRARGPSGAPS